MRLLIAMMKHETNTFSPVRTPLARFGPLYGQAAVRAYRGTGENVLVSCFIIAINSRMIRAP